MNNKQSKIAEPEYVKIVTDTIIHISFCNGEEYLFCVSEDEYYALINVYNKYTRDNVLDKYTSIEELKTKMCEVSHHIIFDDNHLIKE